MLNSYESGMIERVIRIENELGLHARAAARLVKLTSRFESTVKLARLNTNQQIDGKSILGILLLAASKGTELQVVIAGQDEAMAAEAIEELFRNKFGEEK